MRNYPKTVLVAAAVAVLGVIGLNWLVDPYGIWHDLRVTGFNALKPAQASHQRTFEMGAWARQPTPNLILGTSRADIGLDPGHPGFAAGKTYNLAMSGQPLEESMRLLEWAGAKISIQQVIFAMDFFTANVLRELPEDYVESNFQTPGNPMLAASLDTLYASLTTAIGQNLSKILERGDLWGNDGRRLWSAEYSVAQGGHRKLVSANDTAYLSSTYLPPPTYEFSFATQNKNTENNYRRMFAFAHKNHIDLHLLVSPSHARLWEVVYVLGLWPKWEEWKRMLVRLNDEEAIKAGKTAFPLWDFSGHNSITSENFPVAGDTETQMRWYWESSHYKKATGDLVLNRIFGQAEQTVPPDFGVRLTADRLESHLQQLRLARDQWRATHAADVGEISDLATKAAKSRKH
jgi:hypothetical protein